jgi:outer membrane protein OmpA-like peptidoglycan-associated protein
VRLITRLVLVLALSLTVISSGDAQPPAYLVFFLQWSAAVDGPAQDVIKNAADWIKAHPGRPTRVIGFCDPTGSRDANVLLSELRAQVVSDALVSEGVLPSMIDKIGRGSVQFAGTAQESRRVEIRVGR